VLVLGVIESFRARNMSAYVMPTDETTIQALERIARKLKELGVKSGDLKILNWHIGQQRRQIAWDRKGRLYPQKRLGRRRTR
jgi:hypothetical protein